MSENTTERNQEDGLRSLARLVLEYHGAHENPAAPLQIMRLAVLINTAKQALLGEEINECRVETN